MTPNLPATTNNPPVQPLSTDALELRRELEIVNARLRNHHNKSALLSDDEYRANLSRSIEIVDKMNHTTAGPSSTPKAKKAAAKKAGPVSLMDL